MTNEELLKVLDMSEEEQTSWLCSYIYCNKKGEDYWYNFLNRHISLADLAFRLRDEAVKSSHVDFHEAIYDVMMKVEGHDSWATAFWGECIAKPIHWIIAALIVKESK